MSDELLELLAAADVEGFNARRGERSRPELFAADLAGLVLKGVDFSGANLDKADLTGTDLSEANLTRASCAGADATGAKLVNALAAKARFAGAWLDGADLGGCDLTRADLSEAVLSKSTGAGARMTGARLKAVDARGVKWSGVDLTDAHLAKARFEGADLAGCTLGGAVGPEVDLRRARLDAVSARDARFPDANFKEASLVGASLVGANLSGADFTGADLTSADLARANLTNAKLAGAKLRGASLADATLDGASLTGVDLSGVDLTGLDSASLGLSTDQVASLAAVGVVADASAVVDVRSPRAARRPDGVAVLWENVERIEEVPAADDDVEPPPPRRHGTVRLVVLRPGQAPVESVLPVTLDGVTATALVAWEAGYQAIVLRQRAGGFAATRVPIDASGRPGAAATAPLAHEPVGHPVVVPIGSELGVFSIARRGPALVLSRKTDAGIGQVRNDNLPTVQGFAARHHPVLACKGGVVVPAGGGGPGRPLRVPPGFPGLAGAVVPVDDTWLAVWATGAVGREAAAVRTAELALRGTPEVDVLARAPGIRGLDATGGGAGTAIAWLDGDQPRTARGRDPVATDCGGAIEGAREIVLAPATGAGAPAVVVVAGDGSVVARELDGTPIGRWAPPQG